MEEKEKQMQIQLRKLPNTYRMVIPNKVERKIQYLLNNVYNIEWSGVLFYTYDGSFETDDLVITCEDILLMDIGNAGSTEFDMSPDVVAYMAENPELLECQMGLLHSHHSLKTFFSGTDTNTLLAEGKDRNNFVSLIVNNEGTYNAAITRRVKYARVVSETNTYDYFDKGETLEGSNYTETGEEVQYFYLKVERDIDEYSLKNLSSRLTEIRDKKKPVFNEKVVNTGKEVSNKWEFNSKIPSLFDDYEEPVFSKPYMTIKEDVPKNLHYDKKLVHSLVAQIVTGCVTINEEKLGDLNKVNMQTVYKRRFGNSKCEAFDAFADALVEYLIWYTEDDRMNNYDEKTRLSTLANDILDELDTLPDNEFMNVFKSKLFDYI